MTLYQWLIFFLIVQIIHFMGTWKLYEAAGRKRWEAIVPVYNAIVLMKIINRPTWWTVLLFSYYKPHYVSCYLGGNLRVLVKIQLRYCFRIGTLDSTSII